VIAGFAQRFASGGSRAWLAGCALVLFAACSANPLSRKYEYEEDIYLALDGSAIVYVNAAVPALVALHDVPLPVDSTARLDRNAVRAIFESPVTRVANVTTSRRDGRRYVHVRLDVDDINKLGQAKPFAWSTYDIAVNPDTVEYTQRIGAAAGRTVAEAGWTGNEMVAFRVHLPSRVAFHNSASREIRRGNIIVWEQSLVERQNGVPLEIQVRMGSNSILLDTLLLFGMMIVLVILTFAGFIWFIRSRGPAEPST
jgi:hypothetical protein